jgi:hypothetical protein
VSGSARDRPVARVSPGAVARRAPLALRPSTSDDTEGIMATPTADPSRPIVDLAGDVAQMRRRLAPPGGADRVFEPSSSRYAMRR